MGILSDLISSLQNGQITDFLIGFLFSFLALLPALVLHELGHGYVALRCGDPTAKMMGRLTLNPAAHLDPIGTLCMFLVGIGWAKPVPVNPLNLRNRRRSMILVSLAGIITNLILFLFSVLLSVLLAVIIVKPTAKGYPLLTLWRPSIIEDIVKGAVYSDAPFLNVWWLQYVNHFLYISAIYNLTLAIFNFLPIPPLDGYRFWNTLIFKDCLRIDPKIIFGVVLSLFVINRFTGFLDDLLSNATGFVIDNVISLALSLFGIGG